MQGSLVYIFYISAEKKRPIEKGVRDENGNSRGLNMTTMELRSKRTEEGNRGDQTFFLFLKTFSLKNSLWNVFSDEMSTCRRILMRAKELKNALMLRL